MKKVVRSIAVVALMFVAATGLAKEPKLNVTPSKGKSLSLEMISEYKEQTIYIVDDNEEIIFSDQIEQLGLYSKRFDLSKLPEGNYFLQIQDALKVTTYSLKINDSEVVVGEKYEQAKPTFRSKDGRLYLNLLNLDKDVVKIKVLDSEGRIVFQEKISEQLLVEKVFNFQKAYEGTYTVAVQNNNDTYYKDVLVK